MHGLIEIEITCVYLLIEF